MVEPGKYPIPEKVRQRALSEGDEGKAWLENLDGVIDAICHHWGLTFGTPLEGQSAAFVAEVTDKAGEPAILKIATPHTAKTRHEADVLAQADGKGYARLIQHDPANHAMLIEKLGDRLDMLELPHSQQVEIVCATLLQAWMPVPLHAPYPTGADKANALAADILRLWEAGGQPCSSAVLDTALRYCRERAVLYRAEGAVLAHGDPRLSKALVDPSTDPVRFKFIDPDGLAVDPAYDLGLVLRGWNDDLEGPRAHDIARSRVRILTQRTQVPAEPIWQWAYINRVWTGLSLLERGETDQATNLLRVAEALLVP